MKDSLYAQVILEDFLYNTNDNLFHHS